MAIRHFEKLVVFCEIINLFNSCKGIIAEPFFAVC